jgi:hypothetical protein
VEKRIIGLNFEGEEKLGKSVTGSRKHTWFQMDR